MSAKENLWFFQFYREPQAWFNQALEKSNLEHVMNVYTKMRVTARMTGIMHINIWVRQVVHKKEEHDSLLFKHENCILRKYFQSSS